MINERNIVIGEQSDHPQSSRIGRMLAMTAKQSQLDLAVEASEELSASNYEACLVRGSEGATPAIGIRDGYILVGYVPSEDGVFVDLRSGIPSDTTYNQGPKITIE